MFIRATYVAQPAVTFPHQEQQQCGAGNIARAFYFSPFRAIPGQRLPLLRRKQGQRCPVLSPQPDRSHGRVQHGTLTTTYRPFLF